MLTNLSQNSWTERRLKQILFLSGVVGQLTAWIITIGRYYETQPVYVFLCTIISYIFVLIISLTILLKRGKSDQSINGASQAAKTKYKRRFIYSFRLRIAIIIILIIFTGISFLIVYKIATEPIVKSSSPSHLSMNNFHVEEGRHAKVIRASLNCADEGTKTVKETLSDRNLYAGMNKVENKEDKNKSSSEPIYFFDLENYSDYKPRSLITAFIKIDNISSIGKKAFATIGEKREIPYARIIDPDKGDRINVHYGDACAFKIYVRAINIADKDTVTIDAIVINVISYEPLPKYKLITYKPEGREVFYYVEIDDPRISKTNLFKAQWFISKGKKNDFGSYEIEMGHPEQLGIRVNTKRPGIYKFRCEILASDKGKKQKITFPKEYEFLFDK